MPDEDLHGSGGHSDPDRARLGQLEHGLERTWDLLRQREACRGAGLDPATGTERLPAVTMTTTSGGGTAGSSVASHSGGAGP